jgi:hypothetical protein
MCKLSEYASLLCVIPSSAQLQHLPAIFVTQAHIRRIDALYALGRFKDVAAAVAEAEAKEPSFRFLPEYKVRAQQVCIWLLGHIRFICLRKRSVGHAV